MVATQMMQSPEGLDEKTLTETFGKQLTADLAMLRQDGLAEVISPHSKPLPRPHLELGVLGWSSLLLKQSDTFRSPCCG